MTERSSAAWTLLATLKKTKSQLPVGGLRLNSVKNEGVPAPMLAFNPAALSASTSSLMSLSPDGSMFDGRVLNSRRGETSTAPGSTFADLMAATRDGRLGLRIDSVENRLDHRPRADRPGKAGGLHQGSPVMPALGIEPHNDVLCGTERCGVSQRGRQLIRVEKQRHRRHAARRGFREPAWHPWPLLLA